MSYKQMRTSCRFQKHLWNIFRGNRSHPAAPHLTHLTHLTYLTLLLVLLPGCSRKTNETPPQRSEAAKVLFERTSKEFHIPSAEAKGTAKENLQNQTAAGYEQ